MLTRFLSISLLAVSSTVFGVSCNRPAGGDPQPAASCEPPSELPNTSGQWERLIAGSPGLPAALSTALRQGASEEALAANPCVAVREGRVSTVSMASHYRNAIGQYQEALRVLDGCEDGCGDRREIRRRVNDKVTLLSISLEGIEDMNRRYLPAH